MIKLQYLSEQENLLPILAKWYFEEWGHEVENRTLAIETAALKKATNTDKVPIAIIATADNELIGAAQLKWKEMSVFPTRKYWLGVVIVRPENRGEGVARQLIEQLIEIAKDLQITKLFLQTERLDGGLYARMGWQKIEQLNYHNVEVLVMEKNLC